MLDDVPKPVRRGQEALRRAVGDFVDPAGHWALFVQCAGSCRAQKRLMADLVSSIPHGSTWGEVVPSLRCSQCGAPASMVGLSGPPEKPGHGSTWLLLQRGKGTWRS